MINVREFHRPKLGNSEEEYEDAFSYNLNKGRIAIADGASDSIFSNVWAKSLVNAFVNGSVTYSADPEFLRSIIFMARRTWYNNINWDSLRVFVKNKAIKGSFSTFLGVQLKERRNSFDYKVIAVGDTCYFTYDGGKLEGFPLNDPSKFNISPQLIWSGYGSPFPEEYNTKLPRINFYEGSIEKGERLIFATDAMSKWILENGPGSFDNLFSLEDPHGFITGLLEARVMRNDDITYAAVTL